jgi:hypothetical protein
MGHKSPKIRGRGPGRGSRPFYLFGGHTFSVGILGGPGVGGSLRGNPLLFHAQFPKCLGGPGAGGAGGWGDFETPP